MNIILNEEIKIEDNKKSDIDIFIFGNNLEKKIKKIIYLLYYFDNLKLEVIYIYKNNIIELIIKDYRKIQIILTDFENPDDIIYSFDLSNVQIYYNGYNVYTTYLGLNSLINKKSVALDTFLLMEREIKNKNRGYDIINNNNIYLKRSSLFNILNNSYVNSEINIKNIVKKLEQKLKRIEYELYNDMNFYDLDGKKEKINISKIIDISNYPLNINKSSNFIKENDKFICYKDGNISVFQSPLINIYKEIDWDIFILNDKKFIQWLNLNNILIKDKLISIHFFKSGKYYDFDINTRFYKYNRNSNIIYKHIGTETQCFDIRNKKCNLIFSLKKENETNKLILYLHNLLIYE